ncbi:hypothetical protein [Cohnella sp. GCM10012308]
MQNDRVAELDYDMFLQSDPITVMKQADLMAIILVEQASKK